MQSTAGLAVAVFVAFATFLIVQFLGLFQIPIIAWVFLLLIAIIAFNFWAVNSPSSKPRIEKKGK